MKKGVSFRKVYNLNVTANIEIDNIIYSISPSHKNENSYALKNIFFKDKPIKSVTVPHELPSGHKITGIAASLNHILPSDIKSIILAEGIEILDDHCFSSSYANTIYIPDTVKVIPNYCFERSHIMEITGMKNVVSVGDMAFHESMIKKIHWPKGCCTIPNDCFRDCNLLENVTGTDAVKEIGANAFDSCISLHTVEFPYAQNIGKLAFQNSGIRKFVWPDGCKVIPYGCFLSSKITQIENISEIIQVEASAFKQTRLKNIIWPTKCKEIPNECFTSSPLTQIENISQVEIIGDKAFQSTDIVDFFWPQKCKDIPKNCFCNSPLSCLKGIAHVEQIGSFAFYGTKLNELDLSEVSYIFLDASSLYGLPSECKITLSYYIPSEYIEKAQKY